MAMLDATGGSAGGGNAGGGMAAMAAVFPPLAAGMVDARGGGGGGVARRKEERIPQWGYHETREFIAIRAELEKDFTQTKRNKTLWELIAGKMKEKGFRRSADQCKCKWKNLVNRYKGKEISEPDNGRQCPFFEELDAIFKERAKNMNRLLIESDGMRPKKRLKKVKGGMLDGSDDDSDEDDEDDEDSDDERLAKQQQQVQLQQQQQQQKQKKRKADKDRQRTTAEKCRASSMQEVLEDFFHQQQRIEEQWKEALERKEMERRLREQEWRECMEKLEQERAMREHAWWEREEQRRARDEMRSQKRDELVEALLRMLQDDHC